MLFAGIDIGSTCSKAVVIGQDNQLVYQNFWPTGWDSIATAEMIKQQLEQNFPDEEFRIVATGYGRVAVPYADKTVTEITCHAKGASFLYGEQPSLVIDIGGQDTKIIAMDKGRVTEFIMNDKCSAGTGRFLEIMATTLGISIAELCELARGGSGITISSMCTVFAESEVISLIGKGTAKEDIAFGVVESITNKVAQQTSRISTGEQKIYLTGGLCELPYIIETLGKKLDRQIITTADSRYAGAIGAALLAQALE